MSRAGYNMRLLFGWFCYLAYMNLPFSHKFPSWVLAWAGFYANDDGYDAYVERVNKP